MNCFMYEMKGFSFEMKGFTCEMKGCSFGMKGCWHLLSRAAALWSEPQLLLGQRLDHGPGVEAAAPVWPAAVGIDQAHVRGGNHPKCAVEVGLRWAVRGAFCRRPSVSARPGELLGEPCRQNTGECSVLAVCSHQA